MNKKPLCALVIGHSQQSPGAVNKDSGLTEFSFNESLSIDIMAAVKNVDIIRVYRHQYRHLPEQINRLNPDLIISLHANAFNTQATGTEVLHYRHSTKGIALAQALQTNLVNALKLPDRGIKSRNRGGGGGYLLRYTHAPCVIAEPFFIDNNADLQTARTHIDQLVKAYADTIEQYAKTL